MPPKLAVSAGAGRTAVVAPKARAAAGRKATKVDLARRDEIKSAAAVVRWDAGAGSARSPSTNVTRNSKQPFELWWLGPIHSLPGGGSRPPLVTGETIGKPVRVSVEVAIAVAAA